MVHEFVDYMGAAVGMVLIFVSATLYLSGFAVSGVAYNTQQNMAAQAQNLLDYILTSTGSPANWGNQKAYPTAFGLQGWGAPAYSLDPQKLIRLIATKPCTLPNNQAAECVSTSIQNVYFFYPISYYIPYSYTRSLLSANANFEFQLRLTPALNVSIAKPIVQQTSSGYTYTFPVEVYSASDTPVIGANVSATFMAARCSTSNDTHGGQGKCGVTIFAAVSSTTTSSTGDAKLVFTSSNDYPSYSVVATATIAGIQGLGFYTNPSTSNLVYVDVSPQTNNFTVIRTCTTTPCSVVYPNISTYVVTGLGLVPYNACPAPYHITTGEGYEQVSCYGLPTYGVVVIGLANSNCNGNSSSSQCAEEALVVPVNLFNAFGLTLVYGGPNFQGPEGSTVSTTITRVVSVGGFTYIASLTYWPDYGPVYGASP